jgi:hypothetical protein
MRPAGVAAILKIKIRVQNSRNEEIESPSFLGIRAGDEGGESIFELLENLQILDLSTLGRGDIEGVHGHALFRANPGVGGVETILIDGVEKIVEQADAVQCLEFDSGAGGMKLVADEGENRDRNLLIVARLEEIDAPAEVALGLINLGGEHIFEGGQKTLAGAHVRYRFEVGGADPEDVDDDAVSAGEEIGG